MNKTVGPAFITFTVSLLVAGVTGYGVFNYTLGEIKTKLVEHDIEFTTRQKYIDDFHLVKSEVGLIKQTLDSYKLLLLDWRAEQRQTSEQILTKISNIAEKTEMNTHNIAIIKNDTKVLAEAKPKGETNEK